MYHADLSRRLGPAFADAAEDAAMESLDKPGYPAGWGTSPRPAPTAASYKPANGDYIQDIADATQPVALLLIMAPAFEFTPFIVPLGLAFIAVGLLIYFDKDKQ